MKKSWNFWNKISTSEKSRRFWKQIWKNLEHFEKISKSKIELFFPKSKFQLFFRFPSTKIYFQDFEKNIFWAFLQIYFACLCFCLNMPTPSPSYHPTLQYLPPIFCFLILNFDFLFLISIFDFGSRFPSHISDLRFTPFPHIMFPASSHV